MKNEKVVKFGKVMIGICTALAVCCMAPPLVFACT